MKIQEFCRTKDLGLATELSDYAKSGQIIDPAELQALEDQSGNRMVDIIVVETLERRSHNNVDMPRFLKLTKFYGTAIYTVDRGSLTRLDVGVASLVNFST